MSSAVDVVIVTYNSRAHIRGCVDAVRAWSAVATVTVVDNASGDDTVTIAREVADVVIASDRNTGFGTAQNRGASVGSAPYVLILNPDAVVDVEALQLGLEELGRVPDAGAVEGEIRRAADAGLERWCGREPGLLDFVSRILRLRQLLGERRLQWLAGRLGVNDFADRAVSEPRAVDFLAAVVVLARREALRSVGGFDERFFLYAEDVDLSRRLRLAGWRLLALPGPWAAHVGGASSSADRRLQLVRWWEAHTLLATIHWRGVRRWFGIALGHLGRRLDGVRS